MKAWKELGLFNNYSQAKLASNALVLVEQDGTIEITVEGSWGESDTYTYLTLDEIERLAAAARALKEYTEAEEKRVAALNNQEVSDAR